MKRNNKEKEEKKEEKFVIVVDEETYWKFEELRIKYRFKRMKDFMRVVVKRIEEVGLGVEEVGSK